MNAFAPRRLNPVRWLRTAHRPRTEIGLALVLYLVYEGGRALVADQVALARLHAELLITAEKSTHLFWERGLQEAASGVPGLTTLLGGAYMSLHFGGTVLFLIWLYRRHRDAFPIARTALIAATGLALVVHIAYPTAPPRLMGLTRDTVTGTTHVNLNSHLLGELYNPIAAMPSMHFGYALLIGVMTARLARSLAVRLLGVAYPLFVGFVIVATGNHYVLDAAAGAAVMLAGWLAAAVALREPATAAVVRPVRPQAPPRQRPSRQRPDTVRA